MAMLVSKTSSTKSPASAGSLFCLSLPRLSGNTRIQVHPKMRVGTGCWYRPPFGASKFKTHYTIPYRRLNKKSLYHFPEVSKVTGEKINWMWEDPKSGYEFRDIYGPNTIELSNLPMRITPEKMQERLRRFFSKFGHIEHCRVLPHSHDPYQCEGKGYVTFQNNRAVWDALHAPLKLCITHFEKVIQMRSLDNDKTSDPIQIKKREHWDGELIKIADQLHEKLMREFVLLQHSHPSRNKPIPLRNIATSLFVTEKDRQGRQTIADQAVYQRFGTWEQFLSYCEFGEMFLVFQHDAADVNEDSRLRHKFNLNEDAKNVNNCRLNQDANGDAMMSKEWYVSANFIAPSRKLSLLTKARNSLHSKLDAELSPYWRKNKIPLPEHVQKLNNLWLRKPKLPERLQLMSRPANRHGNGRIFCEKLLFRLKLRKERNARRALNRAPKVAEKKEAMRQLEEAKDKELACWAQMRSERRMKEIAREQSSQQKGLLLGSCEYNYSLEFGSNSISSKSNNQSLIDSESNSKTLPFKIDTKNINDLRLLSMLKSDSSGGGSRGKDAINTELVPPNDYMNDGIFEHRQEM